MSLLLVKHNTFVTMNDGRFYLTRRLFFGYCLIVLCGFAVISGCKTNKKYDNPIVVIETKFGDIKLELYPEKAPATVVAFLQNIDSGFFKNSSFYRVLRKDNQVTGAPHSYLIQGGIWQANPELKSRFKAITHEASNKTGILHKQGVISMARNEPGTATSEFFICVEDEPGFDYGGASNNNRQGYAAFGEVIEGMNVVKRIQQEPEDEQRFNPPVAILDIRRVLRENQ